MNATGETIFLLRRAEEEAISAIRSDGSKASAAHQALSLAYSERALEALADPADLHEPQTSSSSPRVRGDRCRSFAPRAKQRTAAMDRP